MTTATDTLRGALDRHDPDRARVSTWLFGIAHHVKWGQTWTEFQSEVQLIRDSASAMRSRPVWPHAFEEEANGDCGAWVLEHRLVSLGVAHERFLAIGCGSCAAHTYPAGPDEVVRLGARLIAWLFLFDDAFGEGLADADMHSLMARLATYETALRTGRIPNDATPFHHALVDLRNDGLGLADELWLARFADSMSRYFDGCVLELPHRRAETRPTIEEYRRLRAWSIGTLPVFDLIEFRRAETLSPDEAALPALAELRELAALLCAWVNDVYSYTKETRDADPLNLVVILGDQYGLSVAEAFGAAAEVFNADMADFELRSRSLHDFPASSDALRAYVRGLADWVHGNSAWTARTRRY